MAEPTDPLTEGQRSVEELAAELYRAAGNLKAWQRTGVPLLRSEREARSRSESRVAEMTKALATIADYSPDAPEVESWKWLARHLQDLARRALAPSEKA